MFVYSSDESIISYQNNVILKSYHNIYCDQFLNISEPKHVMHCCTHNISFGLQLHVVLHEFILFSHSVPLINGDVVLYIFINVYEQMQFASGSQKHVALSIHVVEHFVPFEQVVEHSSATATAIIIIIIKNILIIFCIDLSTVLLD